MPGGQLASGSMSPAESTGCLLIEIDRRDGVEHRWFQTLLRRPQSMRYHRNMNAGDARHCTRVGARARARSSCRAPTTPSDVAGADVTRPTSIEASTRRRPRRRDDATTTAATPDDDVTATDDHHRAGDRDPRRDPRRDADPEPGRPGQGSVPGQDLQPHRRAVHGRRCAVRLGGLHDAGHRTARHRRERPADRLPRQVPGGHLRR